MVDPSEDIEPKLEMLDPSDDIDPIDETDPLWINYVGI